MSTFARLDRAQRWLDDLLAAEGGASGTVHVQRGDDLVLVAASRIPDAVLTAVATVPRGRGMAGAAQVRRAPVSTCNLQTDETGTIRVGARAVDAQAAIALPVFDDAGQVRAVVGLAWSGELTIDGEREAALMRAVATLPA
jgi:L-methionine (R)-S-oxide reductase